MGSLINELFYLYSHSSLNLNLGAPYKRALFILYDLIYIYMSLYFHVKLFIFSELDNDELFKVVNI